MRGARFVGEISLTPEQKYLVNYHSEYMLFRDESRAPVVNFHRYTDHRKPEDDNRSERIKKNVNECVQALNHEDPGHQETYKRIMSRGRVVEQDMGNVAEDQASANDAAYQPSPR